MYPPLEIPGNGVAREEAGTATAGVGSGKEPMRDQPPFSLFWEFHPPRHDETDPADPDPDQPAPTAGRSPETLPPASSTAREEKTGAATVEAVFCP